MRRLFSPSCEARFLDREEIVKSLKKITERLRKNRNVKGVYLFGSLAEGTYTPKSDADILVVLGRDRRPPRDRIPEFLEVFLEAPIPVDVFPFTREEIDESGFLRNALERGINLLTERN